MHDPDRVFKDAIYEQVARIGRAVGHPRRLELLDLLCQGPMTVQQLARKSAMSVGSCSQHLQHLKDARLVSGDRQGTYVVYRLAGETACGLLHTLERAAEQSYAEMRELTEAFLAGSGVEAVDAEALQARAQREPLVLLDVRPPEEYAAGHWPGAISMPLETLADRLAELPADRTIVAYCRGPYCVLALHAVDLMRRRGLRALRLSEGVSDWRARGLPIAREERR